MAFTVSTQIRKATTVSGAVEFQLEATISDAGDLPPDKALFVMLVGDDYADPSTDTFARVATIPDLSEILTSRDDVVEAAQQSGTTDALYYRTSTVNLVYTALLTAVAAKDVLKSRLDELVQDYQTYTTDYYTTGDTTNHPRYNQAAYTLLVTAYTDALETQTTAQTDLDAAKLAYDDAKEEADRLAAEVTHHQAIDEDCQKILAGVTTFAAAAEALEAAATIGTVDPAALANYAAAYTTFTTMDPSCTTFCTNRHTDYTTSVVAKATADVAVATARTDYEDAKAAYDSAQKAVEAALAAIRVLKPTFDPATDL